MIDKLKGMASAKLIFAVFMTFVMVVFIWTFNVRPFYTANFDQRIINQQCVSNNPETLGLTGLFVNDQSRGVNANGWPLEAYSFDFLKGCSYDWHPISLLIDLVILYYINRLIMRAYSFFVDGE